ncbi:hypothetical protein M0R45_030420 [Rubus argutus]|uniref:Uncharacterized protein n=1 Tax=Rubus argutus TaxID=59490 RepID=A0AAW1WE42_RUBAR
MYLQISQATTAPPNPSTSSSVASPFHTQTPMDIFFSPNPTERSSKLRCSSRLSSPPPVHHHGCHHSSSQQSLTTDHHEKLNRELCSNSQPHTSNSPIDPSFINCRPSIPNPCSPRARAHSPIHHSSCQHRTTAAPPRQLAQP